LGYQEILTPTAIAAARNAAQERKVTNVTFVQGDITSLTSYEGWFDTVLDCTLLM
jgi:ubiquinone/menaquinone biosynthesis C-methylase UbiE